MGMRFQRHGRWVYRDKRWPALRIAAKRRDGFKCVQCGARHRLEVDHIEPVRTHPELSFELTNLQTLCGKCHASKTRIECGHVPLSPERQKWRDLLRDMQRNPIEQKGNDHA
ncbi:MAG: HNH endonuclease [Rhodobacteraceae bacterium]|nr:HNH endonuclease [Alphaproteobacteria bacterium]NNK66024.1 HNH endonuclease [Paracoccaceae bacterium]